MNLITPQVIDNIQRTLSRANAEGLRVSPRGGNTTTERFLPPADVDIALDMTRMDRVVEYEPANLTITVEAGMTLATLQETLRAHRQFLPLDPPLPERATVGGILAANAHGPLRFRYGTARDWLIGVRVVLADGTIAKGGGRVVKNVAGYDMPKLFIGSHGTLGVIAEATFKVAPLPPAARTLVANVESAQIAAGILPDLLRWMPAPHAVEILDLAPADGTVPADAAHFRVATQFAGTTATVERQARDFAALCGQKGLRQPLSVKGSDADSFWHALQNLPASLEAPDTLTLELRTLPSRIGETLENVRTVAAARELAYSAYARAGQAVWAVLRGEPAALVEAAGVLRGSNTDRAGYVLAHRVPEAIKPLVDNGRTLQPAQGAEVMRRIKEQFDPNGVLGEGALW